MAYTNPYAYQNQPYQYQMQQPNYQSYAPMPQQQAQQGMIWVDGEVGAKAFQMSQGWPANSPVVLWDTNEPIIYLKSVNQMGMPNPLQKIRYTMEEATQSYLPAAGTVSGTADRSDYATKEDLTELKNDMRELRDLIKNTQNSRNQNGVSNNQNRGVNT